jgi:hypothetical protein
VPTYDIIEVSDYDELIKTIFRYRLLGREPLGRGSNMSFVTANPLFMETLPEDTETTQLTKTHSHATIDGVRYDVMLIDRAKWRIVVRQYMEI